MSESPKKISKKSRKKAIEPPLTLKSRQMLLSKNRQELYNTWLTNQSRHLITQVLEAPQLMHHSTDRSDMHEVQTAFEALQELSIGQDLDCPKSRDLEVLRTRPSFPWPLTAPEGFGPR